MIVYTKKKTFTINKKVYENKKKLYASELVLQRNVDELIKKLRNAKVLTAWHPKEQHYIPEFRKFGSGIKGLPDVVGFYKGKGFAIELKCKSNKLTKYQKIIRNEFVEIGEIVYCVCGCLEEVCDFFEEFLGLDIDKMYVR